MKKILRYSLLTVLGIGLLVLMSFITNTLENENCKEIIVSIEDQNRFGFVTEGDIIEIVNREFNTPVSQKVNEINTDAIEQRLNSHNEIENAEVFITIDRKMHIKLSQRKPIMRVFTKNSSFYIDQYGRLMELSSKYTALVPAANGFLNLSHKELAQAINKDVSLVDSAEIPENYLNLVKLAQFLDANTFWKAQIEQVYVNKDSEIELIPRVGNHSIVLGEVDDLDRKFEKLKWFYDKGLSKTGWNEYKTINLKFNNQVVCTKRY